ncbi:HlyD family secretion protein [Anseongella ginsenosidimutans]|uniref:HlyD family secretion protein n=1 Tax=Anseongella ginsenosidimutans TaxID=496056 RepID=A0A4R3KXU6_9SPHI|nr:HlyD family efflux transporter periplasmic adaptor subunit [Anseongella ginsenosidimutans]QEC51471.1 HlyD family efflux transporter periplasmic adaptor subunit [Anseongella ginsenosidimutans]TCS89816.1 HlyD family secretion protein [Anseongella ginsenosidimutans]
MKKETTNQPTSTEIHSDDIADIIGTPPSSLVRWGITWVFVVLVAIVALTAFIRYPDLVRAPVRINATNAPKAVIARMTGNLVNILVTEKDTVSQGQPLGWMESTADHRQVLALLDLLHGLRDSLLQEMDAAHAVIEAPTSLRLGELQGSYQAFYQSYLNYRSAVGTGIYLKRRAYLLEDLRNIGLQRAQLEQQRDLQQREYALAEQEFERYKVLAEKEVISPSEYQKQRTVLLAKQHPLEQTETSLLANDASRTAKVKELADLDNQIAEEKSKFMQALNSLVSEMQQWKVQHVLSAPQRGMVVYAGIIQPHQHVEAGQEVFYVNPGSSDFFGEVNVPQYNMGKVKVGQEVLLKLDSYPFQEYGVLHGEVGQLNRVPYHDSVFLSRVDIQSEPDEGAIRLTTGMVGTAEIITEDASLLQRLMRNVRLVMERGN